MPSLKMQVVQDLLGVSSELKVNKKALPMFSGSL